MLTEDLVYDVGLHKGEDTAYYLQKGYRVVAFEANPDLVREARRRFAAELASGRLEIVSGAVSDSGAATVTFYQNPGMTVWGTIDPGWAARNRAQVNEIDVPVVRFGDHLKRTGTPYFIKIDIEGADRLCLEALAAVSARPAMLSIEADKTDLRQVRAELDALEELGFDRFAAVQQKRMRQRTIETRTRTGQPLSYSFEPGSSGPFGEDIREWKTRAGVERRYRAIFRTYRLFGENAAINRTRVGNRLRHEVAELIRVPLPGWHDTHAARSGGLATAQAPVEGRA
jgi:FkbM family methyltransferase